MIYSSTPLPMADFQAFFESAPGPYLVLLPDFTIVASSDAFLRSTMTERKSIIGHNLFEVFAEQVEIIRPIENSSAGELASWREVFQHNEGVRNLKSSLKRVLQQGVTDSMAVQKMNIQHPLSLGGGYEERFWSIVNSPIFGDRFEVTYIIHRLEDVTPFVKLKIFDSPWQVPQDPLIRMEAEIIQRAKELEETKNQLIKTNDELAGRERELASLNDKLHQMDQLKTKFFANVGHELRTPLSLILGPLQNLLTKKDFDQETFKDLQLIERNTFLLLRHVNDLLDISKLEAHKVTLCRKQIDLVQLLKQAIAYFSGLATQESIQVCLESPLQLNFEGDEDKIHRILMNLLSNAFKFTPRGGKVHCTLKVLHGERILFKMADSGPGIPAHLRESIFERFFQGPDGEARSLGGAGLGLSIVKEFVDLHQGSIIVGDAAEGGALIEVQLGGRVLDNSHLINQKQRGMKDLNYQALSNSHSHPLQVSNQNHSQENRDHLPLVLIVEDNREMSQFIQAVLQEEYRLAMAYDGDEGVILANDLTPDLILSDFMLPNVSGEEFIMKIRENPLLNGTPVVILTARADQGLRVHLLKRWVQDYLTKPFFPEELKVRLRNLISMKRAKEVLQKELASQQENVEVLANEVSSAQQEVKRSLQLRDEFLSIASHELKTPMTSLKLQLQMAKKQIKLPNVFPTPERMLKIVEMSLRQVNRLTNLVEELLDVSKIQAGRLNLYFEEVNFPELIKDILERHMEQLTYYKCTVELDLPSQLRGHWDRTRIEQVLVNLVSNSIKYAPGTPIKIQLFLRESDNMAILAVQDYGPGIELSKQDKIFDRFERASSSRHVTGLGLGLFITHQIVKGHQGKVSVESEVGQGAKFVIELPVRPPLPLVH